MREFANLQAQRWLIGVTGRAGLAVLYAALLAFLAPFGTYRFGTVELVGYWTVQMAAWLVLSQTVSCILAHLPTMRTRPPVQRKVLTILVAVFPMMIVTGVANSMISGWQPDPGELAELFVSIALIGGGYSFLADWLMAGALAHQPQPATALPMPEERRHSAEVPTPVLDRGLISDTAFIDRLPMYLRGDILCLQVEDHYVRVHGRSGSAMVLMRFTDALRGINHLSGLQVHRSWWVATDAVTGMRRTGRTAQLTLSNGISVPVSQPYLASVMRTWGRMEVSAG